MTSKTTLNAYPGHAQTKAFRQLEYLTSPEAVYPAEAIEAHRAFTARRLRKEEGVSRDLRASIRITLHS
jgi:hypothetical protein